MGALKANGPPVPTRREEDLSLAPRPRLLHSVDELKALIEESKSTNVCTNFADLLMPYTSARDPVFPTFTRFAPTRFSATAVAEYRVIEPEFSDVTGEGAYSLAYPINLAVRDGRNIPIEGLPAEGIHDSSGYPLFYPNLESKVLRPRSTGALFPVNVKSGVEGKLSVFPGSDLRHHFELMFETTAKHAQEIILERAQAYKSGDNHIALLLKAYLTYLDSIAGALDGVTAYRIPQTNFRGPQTNIATTDPSWVKRALNLNNEIVNVIGGPIDYQEFWAHCCQDEPPIYAAIPEGDGFATTPFSRYKIEGMRMLCVSDIDIETIRRQPVFFGRPNTILGHIEAYVQKFSLQHQANEAFQIALLWPALLRVGAHVTLPRPCHAADWLGDLVERSLAVSPHRGLVSSNPVSVLASTLAGAWALQSQIYDYITLLSSGRSTWKLDMQAEELQSVTTWFNTYASAPGVGWDFLFRHQFHVTQSFLYLTGLNVEFLDWQSLIRGMSWRERRFPAHLRLLQPFWVQTSICCQLPWESTFKPDIKLTESNTLLTGSPMTLMRLRRLGLPNADDGTEPSHKKAIFPVLDQEGTVTVKYRHVALQQYLTIVDHGVRVVAVFDRSGKQSGGRTPPFHDPANSLFSREPWPVGGLLQNLAVKDRAPNPLKAQRINHKIPGVVDPHAVAVAEKRLDRVKTQLAVRAEEVAAEASVRLVAAGIAQFEVASNSIDGSFAMNYSPQEENESGWWCALYLSRVKHCDQRSMACLRHIVSTKTLGGLAKIKSLSLEQMAGVCAILGLEVAGITSNTSAMIPKQRNGSHYQAYLSGEHWQILKRSDPNAESTEISPAVDLDNMPESKNSSDHLTHKRDEAPAILPDADYAVELPHNLATKVRVIDTLIERWDNNLLPTNEVLDAHKKLFPGKGLPRFLVKHKNEPHGPRSVRTAEDKPRATHNRELIIHHFLAQHMGPNFISSLRNFRITYAVDADVCRQRWPQRSAVTADKNNLSSADILNVLEVDNAQEALALWFMMKHQGNHTEFVTPVALYLAGADLCDDAWTEFLSSGLLDKNEDTWLDRAKQLHDAWRKNGLATCECDSCWAQMMYPQSLWGRGGVEVDWEVEFSNKASVPDDILAFTGQVWSAEYASHLIRQSIHEVLDTAAKHVSLRPLDQFMDNAYEWLVGGTAAGMPSAFNDEVRDKLRKEYHIQPRASKRSVMEAIPREHILDCLKSRPQIIAKVHQKLNETGGKARAIYGVTLWHYIFSNWLMAPFERAIRYPMIDINIPNDKFLAIQVRRAQQAHQSACFSSYDYPDFNAMHTHYHMAMIYEEAAAVARTSTAFGNMNFGEQDILLQGFNWLATSTFTQACFLAEANEFVQTVGGLYSGNRDTTLINTLLNIAYSKIVDTSCRNMDFNPKVEWRLCHGDDIITQHGSYGAALAWNTVAEQANLKGQEKKLLTDRSYHEYLRVMGCPDGKLRGSLARVCATFVNGNWETDYTPGAYSQVSELQSALAVLERRGMRPAFKAKLWKASLESLANGIKDDDADGIKLKNAVAMLLNVGKSTNPVQLAITDNIPIDPATEARNRMEQIYAENERREKVEVERLFLDLPDNVTGPYLDKLVKSLPVQLQTQENLRPRLKIMLQRSTYGTELPRRFAIEVKQTPQLLAFFAKTEKAMINRGKNVRRMQMRDVNNYLRDHKTFSITMRRIKAYYTLLTALDDLGGYTKSQLMAHLCNDPEEVVRSVLLTENILASDWRRVGRPSASEVGALENELELFLTSDANLHADEEVVLYTEDGMHNNLPVRDLMLY